ncbi:hypothetical protein ABZ656_18830 [Streptomyces sp. NPDC007095]|jgi:hypothetical protein|uniref:hypothetical protein n=1 Tax=Streptomyces sp. NPDC007095 TaxID=3154482 RepID=UPI0026CA7236
MQNGSFNGRSVRTDITPPAGLKPLWEYPDAHMDGFPPSWPTASASSDGSRPSALHFGKAKDDPTPGWLGLHPGA